MTRSDALLAAVLIACGGCAASDGPPAPRPAGMVPAAGFATVATAVEIVGEDFHPRGVQAADGDSTVDAAFRAWLGPVELLDVAWVDARTLRAVVPAGLAPGWQALAVEGPWGTGTVGDAFLVVDGVPASLAVALAMPARATLGDEVQVTVTARNTGTWAVDRVLPRVSLAGDGALAPVGGPVAADVPPGGAQAFVLRYAATRAGALAVSAEVEGIDPRTGAPVSAEASGGIVVRPPPSVAVLAEDPFADGSAFAFVAGFRGEVYAGPNRTGTGIVRLRPDGAALESLALSFARDTVGNNQSANASHPYASIGFTGCTHDSSVNACGPDDENGRGFMTSVSFAGDEWLVLGGAKSGGDLDYVYMTRSATAPLELSYVDLSAALGGNTRGFSAAVAAGGRLYLGFPDNGGERPYGLALLAAPPAQGGLDAVPATHVVNLDLHGAYAAVYGGLGNIAMVDAVAELDGRLYLFDDVGCLAARSLAPATKDDFAACSPAEGSLYARADSLAPARQYDLEPRDRAWPAAVAWRGRLYALRNTTSGPQLWRCDPAAGADPSACDRLDWTLVAADASFRTTFGRAGAVASLLLATATDLWIGFDGPPLGGGIGLFRTSAEVVSAEADFRGRDGCTAGTGGCEGVGGDGFGAPATFSRIFDGKAIDWSGGTDLVLAAGNGSGPVRIVRIAP